MDDIERIDWWEKEKPKLAIMEKLWIIEQEYSYCWLKLQILLSKHHND